MTREEAINIISRMIKDEEGFLSDNTVEAHKMALKALEREPILDKIRAEIESMDFDFGDYYDHTDEIIDMLCKTIDKYKAEFEPQESEE